MRMFKEPLYGSFALAIALGVAPAYAAVVTTVTDTTPGGATVNGTVAGGEYVGTVTGGGSGFGGPVGGATLSVDSDSSGIYLGLSGLGDFSGNSIRVYFDTRSGGFSNLSDAGGFNDFADFGRERLSRPASNGLTLPFNADYGLIISEAFGGFQAHFELATGGNNSLIAANTGNTYSDPNTDDAAPTDSSIETFISYANLGISPGATVDFVLIYANNNDQDGAFMSNEGFPFQGSGSNPGNGAVTISDFHRLNTVPEPGSLALLGLGAFGLLRRRK